MQSITDVNSFLKEFNNFKEASFRNIEGTSETSLLMTLIITDDDGEDLNKVVLEFIGVSKFKILENSVLAYLDMYSGINILKRSDDTLAFVLGQFNDTKNIYDSPMYIIASNINFTQNTI